MPARNLRTSGRIGATGALMAGGCMAALLLAALAQGTDLRAAGWIAGIVCALLINALFFRALARLAQTSGMTWADAVTLLRATLVVGVTALVADGVAQGSATPMLVVDGFAQSSATPVLVALAAAALALDAVDGWVARHAHCVTPLGARFDMEVDALLILVLSVQVSRQLGAWVLAIGLARYALLAASAVYPWLRRETPPRYWNKVVAAIQGIALIVVAAQVLPPATARALLVLALALLLESFAHQIAWLWQQRRPQAGTPRDAPAHTQIPPHAPAESAGRVLLAALILWFALVMPERIELLRSPGRLGLPIEWLLIALLAWLLPVARQRLAAHVLGFALGLLLLIRVLDMGFFEAFDRPADLLTDWFYVGPALGVLQDTVGRAASWGVLIVIAVLIMAMFRILSWATLRLMQYLHRRPRTVSVRLVGALGAAWLACAAAGASLPGASRPLALHATWTLAASQLRAVRHGIADRQVFAGAIRHDPVARTPGPGTGLLAGLRGKDVLLVFVESYGRVAIQGASFAADVTRVLRDGTRELLQHGQAARSAFLLSPTFGGSSWLAHATLQSGLWVDSQQRYDQLLASHRSTLASLFRQAGWRVVADVPADTRRWPQGLLFYGFQKLYGAHDTGYRGPRFSYATMPDQYTLEALYRLELDKTPRKPVFAEVDLVSSHHPWTPLPHMVPWDQLGDGHIFDPMPAQGLSPIVAARSDATVRALYGQSIAYSLNALISFLIVHPDPRRVVIVLGDHQPWTVVSGPDPGHEVPVAIISQDPAVMARLNGWGWQDGLQPAATSPVWRMSAFRDRFLTAFSAASH